MRVTRGQEAAEDYWTQYMSTRQRNAADLWIMQRRPDILRRCACGTQRWRFKQLIEALYADYKRSQAAKAANKEMHEMSRGDHELVSYDWWR